MKTYTPGDMRSIRNWLGFFCILVLGIGIALLPAGCAEAPPEEVVIEQPKGPVLSAVHDKHYWTGKGIDWTEKYDLVCIHGMPYFRWRSDLRVIPISYDRNFQGRAWAECARIEKEKRSE